MKKLILLTVLLAGLINCAYAQTDFRHITFDDAKKAAKAENKLIFVDFFTEWCGPCKMLAKKVFPTKEIGDFLNANYVCLKLDAEKEGMELAKASKVQAYPTLAVYDAEGNLVGSTAGYREGSDFINAIKAASDPGLKPEVVKQKYESGDRTPVVVQAYARQKLEGARNYYKAQEEVDGIMTEYYDSLTDAQRILPENSFIFTSYTNDYSSPRLKFMVDNMNKFDTSLRVDYEKMVKQLYEKNAYENYLGTNKLKDASENVTYNAFKKDCITRGYDKELTRTFNFIEKRRDLDDDAYLAYVDENIMSLNPTETYYLTNTITDVIPAKTTEDKLKISKMLRKHIGDMDSSNLYYVAVVITQLEK